MDFLQLLETLFDSEYPERGEMAAFALIGSVLICFYGVKALVFGDEREDDK